MTGGHEKMTGGHEKMTGGHEKMTGGHEKMAGGHEKMTGGHEKMAGGHEKMTGGHEKVAIRTIERLKFAIGRNEDFIWNSLETYTHVGCIVISDDERAAINEVAMRECNVRGYVSIPDLPLGDIAECNWKLSVAAVHAVYRICLSDRFDKRGQIIMRRGDVFDAISCRLFTLLLSFFINHNSKSKFSSLFFIVVNC
jgi:hypothetical protein